MDSICSAMDLLAAARLARERALAEAERTWTPGQAMGAILDTLEQLDAASALERGERPEQQLRWLTRVLAASVERCADQGLDPTALEGVFKQLHLHNRYLAGGVRVSPSELQESSQALRLEITFASSLE